MSLKKLDNLIDKQQKYMKDNNLQIFMFYREDCGIIRINAESKEEAEKKLLTIDKKDIDKAKKYYQTHFNKYPKKEEIYAK